jgi:phosphoribosylamine---glycine ligase
LRILFLSKEGDGLGVGHRLAREGHDVLFWIKEPRFDMAGRGIVNRIASWRDGLGKADLVICDMVGFGYLEETLKKLGKPTISCSMVLEQAELDRKKGMQMFRSVGIEIPETYDCKDRNDARSLIKGFDWGSGWAIKPSGNLSTAKTYCMSSQEEFDYCISTIPAGTPLILQRLVKGVEVSTEGWFNGRDFLKPYNHTFEEKRFLVGDLGPATGCMGNIVLPTDGNKLTSHTIGRLKPFLAAIGYRGPCDINCIVTPERAYALEVTARMGYDAIEAFLEGLREPAVDLFFETAQGIKKEIDVYRGAMIAVRLSVPPWPMAKPKEENRGQPVIGLSSEAEKHMFFTDIYKEGGKYFTAGGDGVLLKATAIGGTDSSGNFVREAQRRVYRALKEVNVTSRQWRTDIGDRVMKDWQQLKEWGWVS